MLKKENVHTVKKQCLSLEQPCLCHVDQSSVLTLWLLTGMQNNSKSNASAKPKPRSPKTKIKLTRTNYTDLAVSAAVELRMTVTIDLFKLLYKAEYIAERIGDYCTTNTSHIPLQTCSLALSLRFNSHFPDGSGLLGTRTSSFWILLELRIIEVVVKTAAIRHAKLQSNCHQQQTHTQFFLQARCPSCCPTNSVKSTAKEQIYNKLTVISVVHLPNWSH